MISEIEGKLRKGYGVLEVKWMKYIELVVVLYGVGRLKKNGKILGFYIGFYNMRVN